MAITFCGEHGSLSPGDTRSASIRVLQLTQRPLTRQIHATLQHLEGPLEVVKPLTPAEIWIGHLVRLGASRLQRVAYRPPVKHGISHQSISSFHRIPNTRIVDLANTVGSYQQASVYLFRSYDLLRLGYHVSSHALKFHIRP
jgi:hypothetical protein